MTDNNPIRTVWAGQHAVTMDAEVALIAATADDEVETDDDQGEGA